MDILRSFRKIITKSLIPLWELEHEIQVLLYANYSREIHELKQLQLLLLIKETLIKVFFVYKNKSNEN